MERSQVFQFRLSVEELAEVKRLASAAGVKPSVWVRSRALEQALGGHAGEDGVAERRGRGLTGDCGDAEVSSSAVPEPGRLVTTPATNPAPARAPYVKPFKPAPKGKS